ncbi:ATP-binding protein [Sphaerisporangium sp. NPDC051011]|uniref:ATP-binding protein n=1 Tax=Sphaerisporangium sp. NPDC051011 TaxID=3155792 RepID=UPI0033FAF0C8
MYVLKIPGLPSTTALRARQNVRDIAEDRFPGLGDTAARVTAELVSHALHYTPRAGEISVSVDVSDCGVRIEVHDPGVPQSTCAARDFALVSQLAATAGAQRLAEGGHMSWAEIRPAPLEGA